MALGGGQGSPRSAPTPGHSLEPQHPGFSQRLEQPSSQVQCPICAGPVKTPLARSSQWELRKVLFTLAGRHTGEWSTGPQWIFLPEGKGKGTRETNRPRRHVLGVRALVTRLPCPVVWVTGLHTPTLELQPPPFPWHRDKVPLALQRAENVQRQQALTVCLLGTLINLGVGSSYKIAFFSCYKQHIIHHRRI